MSGATGHSQDQQVGEASARQVSYIAAVIVLATMQPNTVALSFLASISRHLTPRVLKYALAMCTRSGAELKQSLHKPALFTPFSKHEINSSQVLINSMIEVSSLIWIGRTGLLSSAGLRQSPVDVSLEDATRNAKSDAALKFKYGPCAPSFLNTGHGTMQARPLPLYHFIASSHT